MSDLIKSPYMESTKMPDNTSLDQVKKILNYDQILIIGSNTLKNPDKLFQFFVTSFGYDKDQIKLIIMKLLSDLEEKPTLLKP